MRKSEVTQNEETLDPQDWEAMRTLGHQMVDDLLDHLTDLRNLPAWQHAPETVKNHFDADVPHERQDPQAVYEE